MVHAWHFAAKGLDEDVLFSQKWWMARWDYRAHSVTERCCGCKFCQDTWTALCAVSQPPVASLESGQGESSRSLVLKPTPQCAVLSASQVYCQRSRRCRKSETVRRPRLSARMVQFPKAQTLSVFVGVSTSWFSAYDLSIMSKPITKRVYRTNHQNADESWPIIKIIIL